MAREEIIAERDRELEFSSRERELIAMDEYEFHDFRDLHLPEEIMKRPEFDKYVLDEYVVSNTKALLKMSNRDFATFLRGRKEGLRER